MAWKIKRAFGVAGHTFSPGDEKQLAQFSHVQLRTYESLGYVENVAAKAAAATTAADKAAKGGPASPAAGVKGAGGGADAGN